jgi:pimeloyl-ACP methyl ester carboxylesterase
MPFDTGMITRSSRPRYAELAGRARGERFSDGRPIVFLHGLTFDRRMWDPILDALPPEQQAIAFDLPGHGSSPALARHDLASVADAVHEAVLAAGLDRPLMVGHSIAAPIASIYGSKYPASGIVNVDAPLRVEPMAQLLRSIAPQLQADFDTVWSTIFRPSMRIENVPEAYRHLLRAGDDVDQQLVLGYWSDLLQRSVDDVTLFADATMRRVADAGVPYLAVTREPFSPEDQTWLRERLPDAELAVWPVGHHFPQLERPEGFAALVLAFAQGLPV